MLVVRRKTVSISRGLLRRDHEARVLPAAIMRGDPGSPHGRHGWARSLRRTQLASKNTICLRYDRAALAAARFYARMGKIDIATIEAARRG
jgi:hypothetical protein